MKAEFDKAMNALLLHVDKSIVDSIRKIGHEYADEVSRENNGKKAVQFLIDYADDYIELGEMYKQRPSADALIYWYYDFIKEQEEQL